MCGKGPEGIQGEHGLFCLNCVKNFINNNEIYEKIKEQLDYTNNNKLNLIYKKIKKTGIINNDKILNIEYKIDDNQEIEYHLDKVCQVVPRGRDGEMGISWETNIKNILKKMELI